MGLQYTLQGSTQRTRTVGAIRKRLFENISGLIGDGNRDRTSVPGSDKLRDHKLENLDKRFARALNRMTSVQPVQELRIEGAFDFALTNSLDLSEDHIFLTRLEAQPLALCKCLEPMFES